jgi:hypothetical protein
VPPPQVVLIEMNRLSLLNYQQMISPITQIHIKHVRLSQSGWLIVVLGDADTLNTVSCRSASPRAILSRAAY